MKHDRKASDKSPNLEELVERLSLHGYQFMQFEIECVDPCEPVDVEWNYKDVAHVSFVHSHMYREFVYVGENLYTTFDFQKILGVTIPQSAAFYSTADNRLIAQSTLLTLVIIVEVSHHKIGDFETRTLTRYGVGTNSFLSRLILPLAKYALKRNWMRFTKDDRPLRSRRGSLRRRGFDFVDKSPLDIRTTTNVGDNGVIPPSTNLETAEVSFSIDQIKGETYFVGSDDHFGLQFTRSDDTIQVFPRLCPHRGCSLDGAPRSNGVVSCPWHGRTFPALCSISISEGQACFNGEMHQLTFDGNRLSVKFKAQQVEGDGAYNAGDRRNWTKKWVRSESML